MLATIRQIEARLRPAIAQTFGFRGASQRSLIAWLLSMLRVVLLALVAFGCVASNSVPCGDQTCPPGATCHPGRDPKPQLCVFDEQHEACAGSNKPEGAKCTALGTAGICDSSGYCLAGCGDGQVNLEEECDDGEFRSNDGCSSTCKLELPAWKEWRHDWIGRARHLTAYHPGREELIVLGGADELGAYGDQWTRDQAGTWKRSWPSVPVRYNSAAAYDSARQTLVVFGGDYPVLGDTWEYGMNGTWTLRTFAIAPPPRHSAAMTYDSTRGRIILYGGRTGDTSATDLTDTWEYDGTTWTEMNIATTGRPTNRTFHALAFDPVRNRVVLFGGYRGVPAPDPLWEYTNPAGTNPAWTKITASNGPLPRYAAAVAFSPLSNKVVVFGGLTTGNVPAGDAWQYDGTWSPLTLPTTPPSRGHTMFTYDTARSKLVMAGGISPANVELDDVWELDDTPAAPRWTEASPRFNPTSRYSQMVYDAARDQIVLFGGFGAGNQNLADTWLFDGVGWTEVLGLADVPIKRNSTALFYDAVRERVTMFGGRTTAGLLGDTWEWDGNRWVDRMLTNDPRLTPRHLTAAADAGGASSVMYGGEPIGAPYHETWTFDGNGWTLADTPDDLVAQSSAAIVYDPDASRTVLFGTDGTTWAFANQQWTRIATTGPTPRSTASMVYDAWRGKVVLYGGSGATGTANAGIDYADMWELAGDEWRPVPLFGSQPPTRRRQTMAWLPKQRTTVLFGGVGLEDAWLLRWESGSPEELCGNDEDEDGDKQPDEIDPDCKALP